GRSSVQLNPSIPIGRSATRTASRVMRSTTRGARQNRANATSPSTTSGLTSPPRNTGCPSAPAATLVAMHARRRRVAFRALGAGALLAIIAVSITDVAVTRFWDNNAMLTGVLADVLVLLVGVAVVNEWLDIRAAERWRTVAYYALVELMYSLRTAWV